MLANLAETRALARLTAKHLRTKSVVFLCGELGAGKTTFVRAILCALAEQQGVAPPTSVPSPSFTLVQPYEIGGLQVLHADLWRIESENEVPALALDEAHAQGAIVLVEWAENGGARLPSADLHLSLAFAESGVESESRVATLSGQLAAAIASAKV